MEDKSDYESVYNGPVAPVPVTEQSLPDENVMRYVVGQFDFLARLIETGGQVCEKVETAGHGYMCKRHGHRWTDASPCPVTYTVSRGELVGWLRTLASELADFLATSEVENGGTAS